MTRHLTGKCGRGLWKRWSSESSFNQENRDGLSLARFWWPRSEWCERGEARITRDCHSRRFVFKPRSGVNARPVFVENVFSRQCPARKCPKHKDEVRRRSPANVPADHVQ